MVRAGKQGAGGCGHVNFFETLTAVACGVMRSAWVLRCPGAPQGGVVNNTQPQHRAPTVPTGERLVLVRGALTAL